MIKELKEEPIFQYYGRGEKECMGTRPPSEREMMYKINELIQRVNVLSKALAIIMEKYHLPMEIDTELSKLLVDEGLCIKDGDITNTNIKNI